MRKYIFIITVLLCSNVLLSQTVSEKLITTASSPVGIDGYSFMYDTITSSYVYTSYDSTTQKNTLYCTKGKSGPYDYIYTYNAFFEPNGDVYALANNNITDTTYVYYLLKNGQEAATFDFINESWAERNGVIYFACSENGEQYLAEYNTSDGKIEKGRAYDEVTLVNLTNRTTYAEGEPIGAMGFTSDNKPYFLARLNGERFLVVDTTELKHYADIDMYSVVQDKNGVFAYFATNDGNFLDTHGKSFVVQGDKEYDKFDYLYVPILFDKSNNPVYTAGDSAAYDLYPQRVMAGNTAGKIYSEGISDLQITTAGTIAYTATEASKKSSSGYVSYVVIDGKAGKKYSQISNLSFTPGGTPLYFASDDEGSHIFASSKEIDIDYPGILDLTIMPDGKLVYSALVYGDEKKHTTDKYFVVVTDETFGPYDGMEQVAYDKGTYFAFDNAGHYAYIASMLKDPVNYIYESILYTSSGRIKSSDLIQNVGFYKGKVLFVAGRVTDRVMYNYGYRLYYGSTPIGPEYNSLTNFNFDASSGLVYFTAIKEDSFYYVKVNL